MPAGKYLSFEESLIPAAAADISPIFAAAAPTSEDLPARLRAAIGRLSRRLRQTGAGYELTPSQVSILLTVVRHGPLRLADLATIESINPTMLSRITGALTERGLIRRTPDTADRRVALVQATPEGRRMRKRVLSERTAALQECLHDLPPQDRAALTAALPALERLVDLLGERDF